MKKRIIYFMLLFFIEANTNIQAQRYTITIDSLRAHFRNEKPYVVLDYYKKRSGWFLKDNYKPLYYDQEMKNFLLQWFDQDQIIDYETNVFRKYLEGFSNDSKNSLVKSSIERDFRLNADSIRADSALWKIYTDSIISLRVEEQRINIRRRKEEDRRDILPDWSAMYLLSKVAYPESYKIMKDWWYQYDKQVVRNTIYFDNLLILLLLMNDPEAQLEFDKIIKEYIRTNGKTYEEDFGIAFINCFQIVTNAYGISKMLELLPIETLISGLTGRDGTDYDPLSYRIYDLLHSVFIIHKIETKSLFDDFDTMRKNKNKIIQLANSLIKELEKEEQYWMENMPFDYIPDLSKE